MAICETHLDSKINLPTKQSMQDILVFGNYQLLKKKHLDVIKRGGVVLFYKDKLPLKQRRELEIIQDHFVYELCFDSKKLFLLVLYQSPNENKEEFYYVLDQIGYLTSNINQQNPYLVIVAGVFNCNHPYNGPIILVMPKGKS